MTIIFIPLKKHKNKLRVLGPNYAPPLPTSPSPLPIFVPLPIKKGEKIAKDNWSGSILKEPIF